MAPDGHATQAFKFLEARQDPAEKHDNLGPRLNIAIWFLTGIAAVFLSLRLYCKRIRRNKFWWDDYVLIASFIALVTQTSMLSVCVHFGFGRHTWDIKNLPAYLYVANITGVCSIIAAAWSKTSFAITLLRLTSGWMRGFVWFVIASVNIFLGLSCIFTYVQCSPVKKLWDSSVSGYCWPQRDIITYNTFSSSWSGAMDIVLAILPWKIINLRFLNKKERIGVMLAMSMGSLAGITSIAKTATLSGIKNPDTIATISLMILATAETAITIVAASVPALRVLIKNTILSNASQANESSVYDSQKTPVPHNTTGFELLRTPSPIHTPLPLKNNSWLSSPIRSSHAWNEAE